MNDPDSYHPPGPARRWEVTPHAVAAMRPVEPGEECTVVNSSGRRVHLLLDGATAALVAERDAAVRVVAKLSSLVMDMQASGARVPRGPKLDDGERRLIQLAVGLGLDAPAGDATAAGEGDDR